MNCRFVLDGSFEKEVKRLSKRYRSLKSDLQSLLTELHAIRSSAPTSVADCARYVCALRRRVKARAAAQG